MIKKSNFHKQLFYLAVLSLVLAFGLLSRHFNALFPSLVNLVLGDFLWALAVFIAARIIMIRSFTSTVAFLALAVSFIIEFSQLYLAPWINDIRANRLGGLVLGYGFLWSDIVAYSAGIGMGLLWDKMFTSGKLKM